MQGENANDHGEKHMSREMEIEMHVPEEAYARGNVAQKRYHFVSTATSELGVEG